VQHLKNKSNGGKGVLAIMPIRAIMLEVVEEARASCLCLVCLLNCCRLTTRGSNSAVTGPMVEARRKSVIFHKGKKGNSPIPANVSHVGAWRQQAALGNYTFQHAH